MVGRIVATVRVRAMGCCSFGFFSELCGGRSDFGRGKRDRNDNHAATV